MNKNIFDIDEIIKNTFQLFQGKRSKEEDEKIYQKVYELTFEEMLTFLQENLNPEKQKKFSQALSQIEGELAMETLLKYLSGIPLYRFRLEKRLKAFIDNLLLASIKNRKN